MAAVMEAICTEAELQREYTGLDSIDTVYFGGGTPSMLEPPMLIRLMESLTAHYRISDDAEITLEANPDDITDERLGLWKNAGINRLSIGIQSFRDQDLKYLNRVHNAERALHCVDQAKKLGFDNLSLDLIFGIPTLDDQGWMKNISTAITLGIPHISAYALTVEPKTALDVLIRKGRTAPVDEQQSARQFEQLIQFMEEQGYLQYEISNYCLPDRYARHNTAYWKGTTYLGLGPSAHSYNGYSRQWNASGISAYLEAIHKGTIPAEAEILTKEQQYNEFIMTGLRTMWGCAVDKIHDKFGQKSAGYFISTIRPWLEKGCIVECNGIYTLTRKGKLLADGIASDLFIVENQ